MLSFKPNRRLESRDHSLKIHTGLKMFSTLLASPAAKPKALAERPTFSIFPHLPPHFSIET
jgi:hypothetical protein